MEATVRLFVDIDGVLADFIAQAKSWGYAKPIEIGQQCKDPELWKIIRKDAYYFAASMCWEKHGKELYVKLASLPLPIIPITHCPGEEWAKGRKFWIECNLPMCGNPLLVPSGDSKAVFCTSKNDLLIDDFAINVEEWRLKGGTAVLWNSDEPERSFGDLDLALKRLGVVC
jgi:hypothetical protein